METLHYLSQSNSLYLHCFMHGILMMSRDITKGRGLEISSRFFNLTLGFYRGKEKENTEEPGSSN